MGYGAKFRENVLRTVLLSASTCMMNLHEVKAPEVFTFFCLCLHFLSRTLPK